MGNCGFTIAPCRPSDRDLVMRNLTHVEGMSLAALREGIRWDFQSFPEYLDALERRGVGPNVACFVGHSSVRTFVLGEDAPRRAATAEEIEAMRSIVVEGLQAGGCGFSTTTSFQHNGENGIPMPSRLADDAEMQALCGSLREVGRGVLMMTKAADDAGALDRGSGCARGPALRGRRAAAQQRHARGHLRRSRAHRRRRARAATGCTARSPCTPLKFEFTMHEPYVFEGLASWAPAMSAHGEAARAPVPRPRVSRGGEGGAGAAGPAPVHRRMGEDARGADRAPAQSQFRRPVAASSWLRETGKHPLDFLLDLSLDEDLQTVFTAMLLNSDEEAVGRMIRDPNSLLSLSDAGAHLTFLCDAGFGLHFLGHWVRERALMPLRRRRCGG